MNIILKKNIEGLGFKYEIISVKPGYARNYLFPHNMAELATKENIEKLNKVLEERSLEEEKILENAKNEAKKLDKLKLSIEVKVGSNYKLFGSINNNDIYNELKKNDIKVDRKNIKISGNSIKKTGRFIAKIRLHRNIEKIIEFDIVPDADSMKIINQQTHNKNQIAKKEIVEKDNKVKKEDKMFYNTYNPIYDYPNKK